MVVVVVVVVFFVFGVVVVVVVLRLNEEVGEVGGSWVLASTGIINQDCGQAGMVREHAGKLLGHNIALIIRARGQQTGSSAGPAFEPASFLHPASPVRNFQGSCDAASLSRHSYQPNSWANQPGDHCQSNTSPVPNVSLTKL